MNDFLWQKGASGAASDEAVMDFMAGDDVILDQELLPFDVRASQAHVRGLVGAEVLSAEEGERLVAALSDLAERFADGSFVLDRRFEDGHSAIETYLTEALGDLGRKVHAGRSRNDQVAVALRLWMKDRLARLAAGCAAIAASLLDRAEEGEWVPMPGYTHLQRAMPSSVGLWLAGHAECFIDDLALARATSDWIDASPLGTASGFGVNLPLPREAVADDLGFDRLVINPQCAQNSRGKMELQAISALAAATRDLRRLSWDISLFASSEFGFVTLPDAYCTGSSIMPNKRNPDAVELMRAVHAGVTGAMMELESVLSLPSGYQRDLQLGKPPLLRAFRAGLQALDLVPEMVRGLIWDDAAMAAAITPEMHATDLAMEQAAAGVPFREAYRQAMDDSAALAARQPGDSLRQRVSPGACGDLRLAQLRDRLQDLRPG